MKIPLNYGTYIGSVHSAIQQIQVTDKSNTELSPDQALKMWCSRTYEIEQRGRYIFFIGNGASAMMASHMAADANKNAGLKSIAFNDAALLTSISNDIGYEESFALPLKRFSKPDDMLVAISSSGNSLNIIRGIEIATELKLTVITLTGFRSENTSRTMGDINFFIPADTYGIVESAHQIILHCWLDNVLMLQNN